MNRSDSAGESLHQVGSSTSGSDSQTPVSLPASTFGSVSSAQKVYIHPKKLFQRYSQSSLIDGSQSQREDHRSRIASRIAQTPSASISNQEMDTDPGGTETATPLPPNSQVYGQGRFSNLTSPSNYVSGSARQHMFPGASYALPFPAALLPPLTINPEAIHSGAQQSQSQSQPQPPHSFSQNLFSSSSTSTPTSTGPHIHAHLHRHASPTSSNNKAGSISGIPTPGFALGQPSATVGAPSSLSLSPASNAGNSNSASASASGAHAKDRDSSNSGTENGISHQIVRQRLQAYVIKKMNENQQQQQQQGQQGTFQKQRSTTSGFGSSGGSSLITTPSAASTGVGIGGGPLFHTAGTSSGALRGSSSSCSSAGPTTPFSAPGPPPGLGLHGKPVLLPTPAGASSEGGSGLGASPATGAPPLQMGQQFIPPEFLTSMQAHILELANQAQALQLAQGQSQPAGLAAGTLDQNALSAAIAQNPLWPWHLLAMNAAGGQQLDLQSANATGGEMPLTNPALANVLARDDYPLRKTSSEPNLKVRNLLRQKVIERRTSPLSHSHGAKRPHRIQVPPPDVAEVFEAELNDSACSEGPAKLQGLGNPLADGHPIAAAASSNLGQMPPPHAGPFNPPLPVLSDGQEMSALGAAVDAGNFNPAGSAAAIASTQRDLIKLSLAAQQNMYRNYLKYYWAFPGLMQQAMGASAPGGPYASLPNLVFPPFYNNLAFAAALSGAANAPMGYGLPGAAGFPGAPSRGSHSSTQSSVSSTPLDPPFAPFLLTQPLATSPPKFLTGANSGPSGNGSCMDGAGAQLQMDEQPSPGRFGHGHAREQISDQQRQSHLSATQAQWAAHSFNDASSGSGPSAGLTDSASGVATSFGRYSGEFSAEAARGWPMDDHDAAAPGATGTANTDGAPNIRGSCEHLDSNNLNSSAAGGKMPRRRLLRPLSRTHSSPLPLGFNVALQQVLLQKQLAAANSTQQQSAVQAAIALQQQQLALMAAAANANPVPQPQPQAASPPVQTNSSSHSAQTPGQGTGPGQTGPSTSSLGLGGALTPAQREAIRRDKTLFRQHLRQRVLHKCGASMSFDSAQLDPVPSVPNETEQEHESVNVKTEPSLRPDEERYLESAAQSQSNPVPGLGQGLMQGQSTLCISCGSPLASKGPPAVPGIPICSSCQMTAMNAVSSQLGLQGLQGLQFPLPMQLVQNQSTASLPGPFPFLPLLSFSPATSASRPQPDNSTLPTSCRPGRFLDISSAGALNPAMFIPSPIQEERTQATDFQAATNSCSASGNANSSNYGVPEMTASLAAKLTTKTLSIENVHSHSKHNHAGGK